jgi:caffeoyl-CoA O-methyltransferase
MTPPDTLQRELIQETQELGQIAHLQVAPELGTLLSVLVRTAQPRFAVEVGTFTGYSSLAIARALPENGRLLCCDTHPEWTAVARRFWHKAGVGDRVELVTGPAIETLSGLNDEPIDFAFIDVLHLRSYYEALLLRLSPHGLIVMDNLSYETPDPTFRTDLMVDPRIEVVTLDIGGGAAIAQKVGSV